MTPLRAQMIYQMQLERLAPKTQAAYVAAVAGLATFYHLHVLPCGFMRLRHYGFLANRHKARPLRRCRELLGQPSEPPPRSPQNVVQWMQEVTGIDLISLCVMAWCDCERGDTRSSRTQGTAACHCLLAPSLHGLAGPHVPASEAWP